MKHELFKHDVCDKPGRCCYCDGGLSFCTVCKGAEASLPTNCPGRPMVLFEINAVSNGTFDFIDGKGWVKK